MVNAPLVEHSWYPGGGPTHTRTCTFVRFTSGTVQEYLCVPLPATPLAIRSQLPSRNQSRVHARFPPEGEPWVQTISCEDPPVQSSPPVGERRVSSVPPAAWGAVVARIRKPETSANSTTMDAVALEESLRITDPRTHRALFISGVWDAAVIL